MNSQYKSDNSINIQKRIDDKAVEYLYENVPTTTLSSTFIPLLTLFVLWNHVDNIYLIFWTIAGLLVSLVRYLLYINFKKKGSTKQDSKKWANYFASTSLVVGLLNGAAIILFFTPDSPAIQAFLLTIVIGLSAGSTVLNAYWKISSYLLSIPILGITAFVLLIKGGSEYIGTSILVIFFLIMLLKLAHTANKSVINTIRLQFEIYDLSIQFQEQKELAENANTSKSKFLAAASHDLRQPLHAMGLFMNLLEKELEGKSQKLFFTKITYSLDSLRELLNTLLDVSKLDAGIVVKNLKHFPLHTLLSQLVSEFKTESRNKGLKFEYTTTNVIVESDSTLLELILRNILSNAVRYTSQGTVQLSVTAVDHKFIKINIKDSGIGIPKDKQQKIFQEFHQLNNPERNRAKGLGLGLSIVNRLVELLNYKLDMESIPGKGTTFSIRVPRGILTKVNESVTENIVEHNTSLSKTAVLIIDDDIQILDAMKIELQSWGCIVAAVSSEQEALDKINIEKFNPQVIVSDYRLRENRTGAQAIKAIQHQLGKSIPALIITGDTAPERLREAQTFGHVLLHKPVHPAQILAFIRHAIAQENISYS